jgi:gliding motility-associated-like protein
MLENMNKLTVPSCLLAIFLVITGCSEQKNVPIYEHFYAPDSFSPNGDGMNDVFFVIKPSYVQISKFHLSIYTGSLQLVFETDDMGDGWNGNIQQEPAPTGFYDYQIIYTASTDSVNYEDYVTSSKINLFR